jgi:hypothetical protein
LIFYVVIMEYIVNIQKKRIKKMFTLTLVIDTTSSMKITLNATIDAIRGIARMFSLLGYRIIVVFYGDYDRADLTNDNVGVDNVVTVIDSNTPNWLEKLSAYKLNDNGTGGDAVEATASAVYKCSLVIPNGSLVIFFNDACGRSSKQCGCQYNYGQLEIEQRVLGKVAALYQGKVDYGKLIQDLVTQKECYIHEVTTRKCTIMDFNRSDFWKNAGGTTTILAAMTFDTVTKRMMDIISNSLGISRMADYDATIRTVANMGRKIISRNDLIMFREIIIRTPTLLKYCVCLSKIYYNSLDDIDMHEHGEFCRILMTQGVDGDVIKSFKEAQNNEIHLNIVNDGSVGPRLYSSVTMTQTTLSDALYMRTSSDELKGIIKGLDVVYSGDAHYDEAIDVETVNKDLSLLISYIARRGEFNFMMVFHSGFMPIFCAVIMAYIRPDVRQKAPTLIDAVTDFVEGKNFLNFTQHKTLPSHLFNRTYYEFLYKTLADNLPIGKKIILERIHRFVYLQSIHNNPIEIDCVEDPKRMEVGAMIEMATMVNVAPCLLLGLLFPSNLFVPCDANKFDEITAKLTEWGLKGGAYVGEYSNCIGGATQLPTHIANMINGYCTPEGWDVARNLIQEHGVVYISTYAYFCYHEYVAGRKTPDPDHYAVNELFAKPSVDANTSIMDQYKKYVGIDGKNIFTMLVPKMTARYELCSSKKCDHVYVRHDNRYGISGAKCPKCRMEAKIVGDRAPEKLFAPQTATCLNGHTFLCTTEGTFVNNCALCAVVDNATVNPIVKTYTRQLSCMIIHNIEFFANVFDIPRNILQGVVDANFSAANYLSAQNNGTNVALFETWAASEECKEVYCDGCPLTSDTQNMLVEACRNDMKTHCLLCCEDRKMDSYKNVCSNSRCTVKACCECIATNYTVSNSIATIQHVQCMFCRAPVSKCNKDTNVLCKKFSEALGSKTQMVVRCKKGLCVGCPKDCAVHCCSYNTRGFFVAEKPDPGCLAAGETEHNADLECPKCVERNLENYGPYLAAGFEINDGQLMRRCPSCKNGIQRSAGCAHMTCTCGEHFCWCCGIGFGITSDSETACYQHLDDIFGKNFVNEDLIIAYHNIW